MRKQDFLAQLRKGLSGLPREDVEERLAFYGELIDDHMEDGLSEEEAVAAVGTIDEIITHVVADTPLLKVAKERLKSKRQLRAWEIMLLALGSPLWLSLGIAAVAVILSLYISLWSVIVSLWAVFGSLIGGAVGGLAAGIVLACTGNGLNGIVLISAGLVCAGLSIFTFYGCKAATKGTVILTKKLTIRTKNGFIRKEAAS